MPKKYNLIYKQLVKNENDILGIVAYSEYKRQKIDFITKESNEDQKITDQQLQSFMTVSTSDSQLTFYKEAAASLLDEYAELVTAGQVKSLTEEHTAALDAEKKKYEKKLRDSKQTQFLYGVGQSLVASVLIILILGVLTFTVWSTKQGITPMIEEIWQIQILDKTEYQKLIDKPNG